MQNICFHCGRQLDSGFNCPVGHDQTIVPPTKKAHTCPVCNGSGKTDKPPWVPGNSTQWISDGTLYDCMACFAIGIIWETL